MGARLWLTLAYLPLEPLVHSRDKEMIQQQFQEKCYIGAKVGRGRYHDEIEMRHDKDELTAEAECEMRIVDFEHDHRGFGILQAPPLIAVGIRVVVSLAEYLCTGRGTNPGLRYHLAIEPATLVQEQQAETRHVTARHGDTPGRVSR